MTGYLRPVDPTDGRISTYWAHTRRTTPSSEAGVDYYCPIGTPIRAAGDGRIFETGGSLATATGRYITLDLYDGRRVRYLHLSRYAGLFGGARVSRGQIIGYSGASGYGSEYFGATGPSGIPANTGGPHVHTTLWAGHYYQFGRYPLQPTLDFELYVDKSATAGLGATPLEVDDMPTMNEFLNTPAYDGGPTISQFFKNVDRGGIATQVWWGSFVDRAGEKIPVIQELADTKTLQLGASSGEVVVDVDEVAIAAALAPLLTSNLGSLSDADVARLAAALADEHARRLANG